MWRHQQSAQCQGIVDLGENCFADCLYTPLVGIGVNVSFQLFLLVLGGFTDIPPYSCFMRRFRPLPISLSGVWIVFLVLLFVKDFKSHLLYF